MPELPEVETVARLLRPQLAGRTVAGARVRWARTVGGDGARFGRALAGLRIEGVTRRAKYLLLPLTRDGAAAGALVGHLRMTGRMHLVPAAARPGPYERVRLLLDDGRAFVFDDVRKFGRLVYAADPGRLLSRLGPEPLEPGFTGPWLHAALRGRRRLLKPLLLDQAFLAGLGNIYVDESLFAAGLHPLCSSARVPAAKAEALCAAIRDILGRAVAREGSSFDSFYRTPEGRPGGFQDEFQVYDRAGEPCRRCGTPIRRIVVGQRGTHLCPRCQPRTRRSLPQSTARR